MRHRTMLSILYAGPFSLVSSSMFLLFYRFCFRSIKLNLRGCLVGADFTGNGFQIQVMQRLYGKTLINLPMFSRNKCE